MNFGIFFFKYDANYQSVDSNVVNASDANAINAKADANATNPDNQSSSNSTCGKTNSAWKHVSLNIEQGKPIYTCLFCLNKYKGGMINKMKQHLVGKQGNIARCKKVPHDVKEHMKEILEEVKKSKDKSVSFSDEFEEEIAQEEEELTLTHPPSKKQVVGDRQKKSKG